jgi:hypothetical protein
MARGPKYRTAATSRVGQGKFIRHESLEPPSKLSKEARVEYDRLIDELGQKGILDRVDLVCVAECAKIKVLLDRAQEKAAKNLNWETERLVCSLTGLHRGRLRDLSLTLTPCHSVHRVNPVLGTARDSKPSAWAGKLKLGG